jgi:hypothetical protein
MKKERFDRLIESLQEVRDHVAGKRFAGRTNQIEVCRDVVDALPQDLGKAR